MQHNRVFWSYIIIIPVIIIRSSFSWFFAEQLCIRFSFFLAFRFFLFFLFFLGFFRRLFRRNERKVFLTFFSFRKNLLCLLTIKNSATIFTVTLFSTSRHRVVKLFFSSTSRHRVVKSFFLFNLATSCREVVA